MSNLMPEDQEGRETLSKKIEEAVSLLREINELKQDIKNIAEEVEEKLEVKKPAFNKLAKSKFKEDARKAREAAEDIEQTLDILFAE